MKKKASVMLALVLAAALAFQTITKGRLRIDIDDALSACYADVTGDGAEELIVLTRSGESTPHGECGKWLYILSSEDVFLSYRRVISRFDLTAAKPLKVMAGDVNRDGIKEVSIKAWKTAAFDPQLAQRPFFFNVSRGKLEAVWLGSRLSQPFIDYVLTDFDGDGFEEIVSLEQTRASRQQISAYRWDSFGFVCFARSDEYDGLSSIEPQMGVNGIGRVAVLQDGSSQPLRFALRMDKISLD
ncbi:MAG: hypothetical protein LBU32_29745 [Clostridiales bacterium]|jgi:hypothetical protein|nr:hypothetical protein [Clostridiales bacterium]